MVEIAPDGLGNLTLGVVPFVEDESAGCASGAAT
jgi:hypothetical protein